jgi:hypothetical protein
MRVDGGRMRVDEPKSGRMRVGVFHSTAAELARHIFFHSRFVMFPWASKTRITSLGRSELTVRVVTLPALRKRASVPNGSAASALCSTVSDFLVPNQRMLTRTAAIAPRNRCAGDVAARLVASLVTVLMDGFPYVLGVKMRVG